MTLPGEQGYSPDGYALISTRSVPDREATAGSHDSADPAFRTKEGVGITPSENSEQRETESADGNSNDTSVESADNGHNTGVGHENKYMWSWLGRFMPTESDTSDKEFTGPLSTYVEWHALILGVALGFIAGAGGDYPQLIRIAKILGLAAGGSRAGRLQIRIPEKFKRQIFSELPYFVFGAGVAFFITQSPILS